ncbi:MAG: DUF2764 domain-containing protein [Lentisphaerae bacterium]|nr:DUF2764 domain-containing protein [Lentisphaerota bacterium]
MNYYYFAASLPTLALDAPPPLRMAAFLTLCQEHLRAADYETVRQLLGLSDARPGNALLREWHGREVQLRNALVRARAARLGRDATPYLRPEAAADSAVDKAAAEALSRPAPHERELALDRFRWAQADEMAGYNPFSVASIVAYALKLKLAERWATLDEQAGRAAAEALVAQPAPAAAA